MDNMKVQELKAEAKRLGLRGYSRLRKAELINLLAGAQASPSLMNQFQKLMILKYSDQQSMSSQREMMKK